MKKLIKKLFGNTLPFKVVEWAYAGYIEEKNRIHAPEKFKEYGEGVWIERTARISHPERVIIKDNSFLGRGVQIDSIGGVYIGKNTGVAQKCVIITSNHRYRNADAIPFDKVLDLKPVIIRDYVMFGIGVMVMPGVEIGEGAILALGSVITKNVPPLAIVVGNPAEIIGYRSKEHFYKCKSENKTHRPVDPDLDCRIIEMYKVKYAKELKELGLI